MFQISYIMYKCFNYGFNLNVSLRKYYNTKPHVILFGSIPTVVYNKTH